MEPVAIYGAGDHGRLVAWTIEAINGVEQKYELVCFIDDNEHLHGKQLNEFPIVDLETANRKYQNIKIAVGIGNPRVRQNVTERIMQTNPIIEPLVYPNVQKTRWVEIGEGTLICAGSIISSNITIGKHALIGLVCTVGHDAVIEDYASLFSGVNLGGYVHIGARASLGMGAIVLSGTKEAPLTIGPDAVVGAGALVTKSVPPGATVVGVPAKVIK